MRLRSLVPLLSTAVVLVIVACVGDDPGSDGGSSGTAGDRGGPCKNGVCLAGLSCVDNICVLVGGGGDAGASDATSVSDGDSSTQEQDSSAQDSGPDAPAVCTASILESGKVQCPTRGSCPSPQICCVGPGALVQCKTVPADCPGASVLECDGPDDCAGSQCCLDKIVTNVPNQCPPSQPLARTFCNAACPTTATVVCSKGQNCGAGMECRQVDLVHNEITIKLNVCLP